MCLTIMWDVQCLWELLFLPRSNVFALCILCKKTIIFDLRSLLHNYDGGCLLWILVDNINQLLPICVILLLPSICAQTTPDKRKINDTRPRRMHLAALVLFWFVQNPPFWAFVRTCRGHVRDMSRTCPDIWVIWPFPRTDIGQVFRTNMENVPCLQVNCASMIKNDGWNTQITPSCCFNMLPHAWKAVRRCIWVPYCA